MKRYKKGIETRNNIIEVSKSLFYYNGYKKTTVQKISDLADVNLGLLSYYFKTKKNIARICFYEYLEDIEKYLSENMTSNNNILKHLVLQRIYYNVIFNDPNNLSFYKEVVLNSIIYDIMFDYTLKKYREINKEMNYNYDENLIQCFVNLNMGGKYNVLKNYFKHKFSIEYNELIGVLICCTPKLFSFNKDTIETYIVQSNEVFKNLDYSEINFLISNN